MPLTIIFFPETFIVQYFVMTMSGLATISLLMWQQPYQSQARNRMETVEELSILVIMYHIICFTEWMPDLDIRYYLGYSVVFCVAGQLIIIVSITYITKFISWIRGLQRNRMIQKLLRKNRT